MNNEKNEKQLSWDIDNLSNNNEETFTFELPLIDKKVTPTPFAENYRQSNWLSPTIISMNTYSNRIFQGILSAWNMKYIQRENDSNCWLPENINKMDNEIHFKVSELFKEVTDSEFDYAKIDDVM